MSQGFKGWKTVADRLHSIADSGVIELNDGQKASLRALAERLPSNGVIIADEVGMGKTRIATALARSVTEAGGRVAILVPPGLGYQWNDELHTAGINAPPILRSLWQYLAAWKNEETPAPWFNESALVISHAFTNWRLSKNRDPRRWALLPEIYARWRKQETERFPYNYHGNEMPDDKWVQNAAKSIVSAIYASPEDHPARKLILELTENTPWSDARTADEYGSNAQLRPWLERAVGLGLGVFDLVIVDEAHKSRGQDSGLNRLLNGVVLQSTHARCLAMTATPVELEATQWSQMLDRIQVNEKSRGHATEAIDEYAKAVAKVRQCPSDKQARERFKASAKAFKNALDPYLLRRDKREDQAVIQFQNKSGENYHAYRHEEEILIDTAQLSSEWKQTVCAAEALSFVTRQSDQTATKRLRLTLGNGHGLTALIDELRRDGKQDHKQTEADGLSDNGTACDDQEKKDDKRLQRAEWWSNVMIQPFMKNDESALFDHPAILAAVEEIEAICRQGEKVLVFGRFTRPLRALVQLLNAREMLRCVDEKLPWPQSKVHENDNWNAIASAHRQLQRQGKLDRDRLNEVLAEQYKELKNQRQDFQRNLISNIEKNFSDKQPDKRVQALFDAFKKAVKEDPESAQNNDNHSLAVVARAMQELVQTNTEHATSDFAQAFIDLVAAASDRDEGDADGDGQLNELEASELWTELKKRLDEEYNRPEGGYARLMFGETKPETRRFLQLAFNRKHSHPKVLVAQSLVGREGLNLHKACRTVVLLHPEWNPGVVEQQIGRIDRIGSLWEEKLNQVITDKQANGDLPRIEIRPVVFRGTYDEKNWKVLQERWGDLRAQLHGIVISPCMAEKYPDAKEMITEINKAAPNFSPSDKS